MTFYELSLDVSKPEADKLETHFLTIGAVSVTYTDAKDSPIYEPLPGQMPLWDKLRMTGLFDDKEKFEHSREFLIDKFSHVEILATELKDQIWERVWMDYFKPMKFGQSTWVIPEGYEVVDSDAVNLILDPGLAFGTGTHPTTSLCLTWLDQNKVKGLELVDFGCGSGILAVAALLHGAKKVYCVDIDEQAIEATQMNARKNQVLAGIKIIPTDSIHKIKQVDGILANILAEPLLGLKNEFFTMLKSGGFVVLSGILRDQAETLRLAYSESFKETSIILDGDWALLSAVKA